MTFFEMAVTRLLPFLFARSVI